MQSPIVKDVHSSNPSHQGSSTLPPPPPLPSSQQRPVRFPFVAAAAVVVSCLASTVGSQLSNIAVSTAPPTYGTYSVPPTSASSPLDDGEDAEIGSDQRCPNKKKDAGSLPRHDDSYQQGNANEGGDGDGFYYDYAFHDYEDFDGTCESEGYYGSYSYTHHQKKNPSFSSKKTNSNAHHQQQQKDARQSYLFSILRDSLLRENNGQSDGGRKGGRGEREGEEGDCGGENSYYGRLPPTANARYCHHDDAHHGQRKSTHEGENDDTTNNDAFDTDTNNNNNNMFSLDYYEAQFEAIDAAIRSHSKRSRQQQQQRRKRGGGGAANKDQEQREGGTADHDKASDRHHHEDCHDNISPSSLTDAGIHATDKNDDDGGDGGAGAGADNTCGDEEGLPDHFDDDNNGDATGDDGCHNADDQNCPQTDDGDECDGDNDDTEQTKKKKRKGCKGKGKKNKNNKTQKKKRKAALDGFETDTDAEDDENDEDENVIVMAEGEEEEEVFDAVYEGGYHNERKDQKDEEEQQQQQITHSTSTTANILNATASCSVAEIHAKARKFMEKTMRGPFCSVTLAYDYSHHSVACGEEEQQQRGNIFGLYDENDGSKSHHDHHGEVPFYQIAIPSTTTHVSARRTQHGHVEMSQEASSSSVEDNTYCAIMASSATHRETEGGEDVSFEATKAIELFAPPLIVAKQQHQQQRVDDATHNNDDVEPQQQKQQQQQHQHVRVIAVATLNGVDVRRIVVGSSSSPTAAAVVGIPSTTTRRGARNTTGAHEQNDVSSILHASTSSKSSSSAALHDLAKSILFSSSSSLSFSSSPALFLTSALAKKGAAEVLLPMLNGLLAEKVAGDDEKEKEKESTKEQLLALASTMSQAVDTTAIKDDAIINSSISTADHPHEDLQQQQQYQQQQQQQEKKQERLVPSLSIKTPQGTLFEFQSPFRVKGTMMKNEAPTTANDDKNNDEKKGGEGVPSPSKASIIHLKFVATERLPSSLSLPSLNAAGVAPASLSIAQSGHADDGRVPLPSSSSSSQKGMSRAEKQRARAQKRKAEAVSSTTRVALKDEEEKSGGNVLAATAAEDTCGGGTDTTPSGGSFSSSASLIPPIIAPAPSEEVLRMQVPFGTDVPASSRRVFIGQVPKRNVEKTLLSWLSFVAPSLIVRRVQPMTKASSTVASVLPFHSSTGGKKIVHHHYNQKRTQQTEQQNNVTSCSSSAAPPPQQQPSSPPLLYTGGTSVYFEDQSHADAALTLHKRSFFDVITINDADGSIVSSLFSPQPTTTTSSSSSTTYPQQTVATKKRTKGILSSAAAVGPTASSSSSWLGFWTIDCDDDGDEVHVADAAAKHREEQHQQRFVKEFASVRQQDTFRTQFKHWVCLNEINVEIPQNQERTRSGVVNTTTAATNINANKKATILTSAQQTPNANTDTISKSNDSVQPLSNASIIIQKTEENEKKEYNGVGACGVSAQPYYSWNQHHRPRHVVFPYHCYVHNNNNNNNNNNCHHHHHDTSSAPLSHPSRSQHQQKQQPSFLLYGPSGYADTSDARVLVLPPHHSSSSSHNDVSGLRTAAAAIHFRHNPYGTIMLRTMLRTMALGVGTGTGTGTKEKQIMANEYTTTAAATATATAGATTGDEDDMMAKTKLNDVTESNNANSNASHHPAPAPSSSSSSSSSSASLLIAVPLTPINHTITDNENDDGDSTCTEHGDDDDDDAPLSFLGDEEDADGMMSVGERMDSLWVECGEEEEGEGKENGFAEKILLSKTLRGEGDAAEEEQFLWRAEVALTKGQHTSLLVNFPQCRYPSPPRTTRASSSAVSVVSVSASSRWHGSTPALAGGYATTDDW